MVAPDVWRILVITEPPFPMTPPTRLPVFAMIEFVDNTCAKMLTLKLVVSWKRFAINLRAKGAENEMFPT